MPGSPLLRHPDADDAVASREPGPTTQLVLQLAAGEDLAVGLLWSRIHGRVREMAARALGREPREGRDRSIEPTDVVAEVFLRLHGGRPGPRPWQGRSHFFGSVARSISQLLVDRARGRRAGKRGGGRSPASLVSIVDDGGLARLDDDPSLVESLHAAMDELSSRSPRAGEVAWLRYVIGLTTAETAETLGISRRTVDHDWAFAQAWLRAKLSGEV